MNDLSGKLFYRLELKKIDSFQRYDLELERMGVEIYLTAEDLKDDNNLEKLKQIRKFVKLNLHAPFYDLNITSSDPYIRKYSCMILRRSYSWATKLKAEILVVHLNSINLFYQEDFKKCLDEAGQFFQKLLVNGNSTLVALENSTDQNPEVFLNLQQSVKSSKLILCLDIGHLNIYGRNNMLEWLNLVSQQNRLHIHIHDNFGEYDQHLPAGMGSFNWLHFLKYIQPKRQELSFTFESFNLEDILISRNNYLNFWRLTFQ